MSVLKVYGPILIGFRFIHQLKELLRFKVTGRVN